jgi:hypothetical protein
VRFDDMFGNSQAETGAVRFTLCPRVIHFVESFKDARQRAGRNSNAGILHLNLDDISDSARTNRNATMHRGELDRVVRKIA